MHVLVAAHRGIRLKDGGSNKVAIGVGRNRYVAAVEENLATLFLAR
jgi:hypothetical protein